LLRNEAAPYANSSGRWPVSAIKDRQLHALVALAFLGQEAAAAAEQWQLMPVKISSAAAQIPVRLRIEYSH
jgi:hypothetical protein